MKSKALKIEKGLPLTDLNPDQKLWTQWLGAQETDEPLLPVSLMASEGLRSTVCAGSLPAKIHFSTIYTDQLIGDLDDLIDDEQERALVARAISSLGSAEARAVVTGQQPGFSGGPLYSLFKIATTVALSRLRNEQGHGTVPVFWMGDDDDDWQELLDPLFWDGLTEALVGSELESLPRKQRLPMIGSLGVSPLEDQTFKILESVQGKTGLAQSLHEIFQKAKENGRNLSFLTEKVLRLVFKGTGLIIVRGNDPRLHAQCSGFYDQAVARLPELTRLTHEHGLQMAQQTGKAALNPNSINRPLYVAEGNQRQPWDGISIPKDPSTWRCGVLLRSMLQDWLLQPAAVIVGPGEISYLSQLMPAYECMGVSRSPLVPRLFGWILPDDLPRQTIEKFTGDRPLDQLRSQQLAKTAGAAGEEKLVEILVDELNITPERARELAAGRTRRWVKGVQALLSNESQKEFEKSRPSNPAWVFPRGKRQERKLAWIPVAAIGGMPLIEAVLEAGRLHLEAGMNGQWNEYWVRTPQPEFWKLKGSDS